MINLMKPEIKITRPTSQISRLALIRKKQILQTKEQFLYLISRKIAEKNNTQREKDTHKQVKKLSTKKGKEQ